MVTVHNACIKDRVDCVKTLSHAFNEDPVVNWFIRQDRKRNEGMSIFFNAAFTSLTLPFGHVYTTGDRNGVALWTPPGKWKLGIIDQLKLLPQYSRAFRLKRLHTVIPPIQRMQDLHPDFPHYYLFALGVKPGHQSRGIGSRLLKEVLMKCDRENLPAYLEATSPANRDLYIRHGFKVIRKFYISANAPCMWFMLRYPQREYKCSFS